MNAFVKNRSNNRVANLLGALSLGVTDTLTAAIDQVSGTTLRQSSALVTLATYPGLTLEALRRVLGLSQPATVHLVDKLAAVGLAERRAGVDARSRALALTAEGRRATERIQAARLHAIDEMLTPLTQRERKQLERLLMKLLAGQPRSLASARRICRLCDEPLCMSLEACPIEEAVAKNPS